MHSNNEMVTKNYVRTFSGIDEMEICNLRNQVDRPTTDMKCVLRNKWARPTTDMNAFLLFLPSAFFLLNVLIKLRLNDHTCEANGQGPSRPHPEGRWGGSRTKVSAKRLSSSNHKLEVEKEYKKNKSKQMDSGNQLVDIKRTLKDIYYAAETFLFKKCVE